MSIVTSHLMDPATLHRAPASPPPSNTDFEKESIAAKSVFRVQKPLFQSLSRCMFVGGGGCG